MYLGTTSSLSSTEWSFITYVVNINVGVYSYFNALREGFKSIDDATTNANQDVLSCSTVHIGAKNSPGHYAMNGDLDEIKWFYRDLSPAGTVVN